MRIAWSRVPDLFNPLFLFPERLYCPDTSNRVLPTTSYRGTSHPSSRAQDHWRQCEYSDFYTSLYVGSLSQVSMLVFSKIIIHCITPMPYQLTNPTTWSLYCLVMLKREQNARGTKWALHLPVCIVEDHTLNIIHSQYVFLVESVGKTNMLQQKMAQTIQFFSIWWLKNVVFL